MSHGKQFTLFTHKGGPNGWKVAMLFEELGLTYESVYLDFNKGEQKGPEHVKYNPNGRIPTIVDHKNGDFSLWESDAILLYLVEKYDPEQKLTATTEGDKFQQLQWLFFQSSGQGPYYGQAAWFTWYHPEKIPSAVERYKKEIRRVLGVLEGVLSKQEWLVAGKYTITDLSFVTWNQFAIRLLSTPEEPFTIGSEFPAVAAWHDKMEARAAITKVNAIKVEVNKA